MAAAVELLESQLTCSGPTSTLEHLCDIEDRTELDGHLDALVELARTRALTDPTVAYAALEVCGHAARRLERPDLEPQRDYIRARIELADGRPDAALELIESARRGWLTIDRPLDAFRTDLGRMNVLDDLGRHREAVDVGEHLVADLDQHEAKNGDAALQDLARWLRAAAQENLGAAYGYTGQHQRAMDAYGQAEKAYDAAGGEVDMARCRANRGVEQVAMGHALVGHQSITQAAQIFRDADDHHSYAKCLGHQADAELLLGWYTACLDHITEARSVLSQLDATTESIRLALTACRAYVSLNLWGEAIDIGSEAEQSLADLGLPHDLAEARLLLATALAAADAPKRALAALDTVVAGAEASDDPPLRMDALTLRGRILAGSGSLPDAELAVRQAVEIGRKGQWPVQEWAARMQLARLLPGDGGADHLRAANTLAETLNLPQLRYGVLLELGRRARDAGRVDDARRLFDEAVAVIENLRGQIGDAAIRTSFLEGRTAAHDESIATVLLEDNRTNYLTAFDLAERSRARTLADMIAGGVERRPDRDDSHDAVAELQSDLVACYGALLSGTGLDRERRRIIQQRATELETALQRARLEIGVDERTTLSSAPGARSTARPVADEQLVQYHIADERLIAFVWSGGRLEVVRELPTLDETRRLVEVWVRHCERHHLATTLPAGSLASLTAATNKALEEIWAQVFAPVVRHLQPGGELLVSPFGPLHAVPFHALAGPDGRVGDLWTVALTPSYAVAHHLKGRSSDAERSLVIGVADEAAPAVDAEATTVASLLPDADLLLGDRATVDQVRTALEQPRDVIHFACHGLHRSQNPMFSALKLADGWLSAHDVMSLELSGSLVVLSACETGRQERHRLVAEPVGLARSFLAVGARAVIVSLWKADDAVTAELMSDFYRQPDRSRTPAAALQRAQQVVAHKHPHPAAWASFAIYGGLARKGNH